VVVLPPGAVVGVQGAPDGVIPEDVDGAVGVLPGFPALGDELGFDCAGFEPGFDCAGFDDPGLEAPAFVVFAAPSFGIGGFAAVWGNGGHGTPLGVIPGVVCVFGVAVDGWALPGAAVLGLCGFCPGTGVAVLAGGVAVPAGGVVALGELCAPVLELGGAVLPAGLLCAAAQAAPKKSTNKNVIVFTGIQMPPTG
jgi:hypothetical protein